MTSRFYLGLTSNLLATACRSAPIAWVAAPKDCTLFKFFNDVINITTNRCRSTI